MNQRLLKTLTLKTDYPIIFRKVENSEGNVVITMLKEWPADWQKDNNYPWNMGVDTSMTFSFTTKPDIAYINKAIYELQELKNQILDNNPVAEIEDLDDEEPQGDV